MNTPSATESPREDLAYRMAARCYKTMIDLGAVDSSLGRQTLTDAMAKDLRRMPDLEPTQLVEETINLLVLRSQRGQLPAAGTTALVRLQEALLWLNNLITGRRS
mgnify:CR=1 FL=1